MPSQTIYFFECTDPVSGKRYRTRYRLTEEEAKNRLIDPVRQEYGSMVIEEQTPDRIAANRTSAFLNRQKRDVK